MIPSVPVVRFIAGLGGLAIVLLFALPIIGGATYGFVLLWQALGPWSVALWVWPVGLGVWSIWDAYLRDR